MLRFAFAATLCVLGGSAASGASNDDIKVSLVLEPFDLSFEEKSQDIAKSKIDLKIIEEYDYTPGNNVTFAVSDPSALSVTQSTNGLYGDGALRVWLEPNSESSPLPEDKALTWVVHEEQASFNCMGASHLSLYYKIPVAQPDVDLTLTLLDDSACGDNCTPEKLLSFASEVFTLQYEKDVWRELTVDFPLNGMRQDHVRGWQVNFATNNTSNAKSIVLLDQLACVGGGDLIGSAFFFNDGSEDPFTDAVESDLWGETYYRSDISEANTRTQLVNNGMLALTPYVIEQTESWGGFLAYDYSVPGNGYYNLSEATELTLEYDVDEASSHPGRAHLRLILRDGSDCPQDCAVSDKNVEVYYSFNYVLDEIKADYFSVGLQGTDDPASPLWLPGWAGSIHDAVFDPSFVKGYAIELSMDSQGNITSLVKGAVSFGKLVATNGMLNTNDIETNGASPSARAVVEPGLLFTRGDDVFSTKEFNDLDNCIDLCVEDVNCLYGFSNGRDCFMASYLEPSSVGLPATTFLENTFSSFWISDPVRQGNFCEVCTCDETSQSIDCNGRDLPTVPNAFDKAWSPKVLDLSGNPRLLVIGAGSLDHFEDLQALVLPESLVYLAPGSISSLPNMKITAGQSEIKNAIEDKSQFFSDICCRPTEDAIQMSFCEMKVDQPGLDSIFSPFTQYINAGIVSTLTPRSEFGSEAAESPEKCAEYCSLFPDCNYFSYDARYDEAEHTCFLLSNTGSRADHVCCDDGDYADLGQTIPGWTSGVAPRTRSQLQGANVNAGPAALRADETNHYSVEFELSLGAMPMRGAVWIEPTVVSQSDLDYKISPERAVLYDNTTVATVTLEIFNPELVAGVGETLVISNKVESCDAAFTALEANSVFVRVLVPQEPNNEIPLIIGISVGIIGIILALAAYVIYDRRRIAKMSGKDVEDETEVDEVYQIEHESRSDNVRIDLGRGLMVVLLIATCVSMTTWFHDIQSESDTAASSLGLEEESILPKSANAYIYVLPSLLVLLLLAFLVYDWLVRRRNRKLVLKAAKSNEIMSTMFPEGIRERLLNETRTNRKATKDKKNIDFSGDNDEVLADLYPHTSIAFIDIAGFTAWSSSKEPIKVFQLLETCFGSMDKVAKKMKVYKVETIGDCYVAITGAPVDQADHAVRMCRFASRCLAEFKALSKDLVVSLGPDTAELQLRAGIHSGQVTMGVLRGARARYQLFGDSVNVSARMETTGKAGKIQISMETAELLRDAGRGVWATPRSDSVVAKGKGEMKTFWLDAQAARRDGIDMSYSNFGGDDTDTLAVDEYVESQNRLIDWNAEQLIVLLKKIVAFRQGQGAKQQTVTSSDSKTFGLQKDHTYLDEVAEIIQLPQRGMDVESIDVTSIRLDKAVEDEVRKLVSNVAAMYNNNPFHNFEHASHVVLSILKLLSRIVKPSIREKSQEMSLNDHSYGITNDPLTHFAVAFCGLIHDADHPGVPNTQLLKEDPILGARFEERSIAEQNSLRQCFDLITRNEYSKLRGVLFGSNEDQSRFRQLVVNTVMATDIVDKDLKAARNARWDTAFKLEGGEETDADVNRKATIVIEHLIQASDVSHTMQHWNVYTKWNEKLLKEMYKAYVEGRAENDPRIGWAKGEIGFFDFYIIPLAKKLKECGVFGVSSDEYLNYALINRRKWEEEGAAITAEMVARLEMKIERPLPKKAQMAPIAEDGVADIENQDLSVW